MLKLWCVGPHLKIFPTHPPGEVMDVLMPRYDARLSRPYALEDSPRLGCAKREPVRIGTCDSVLNGFGF